MIQIEYKCYNEESKYNNTISAEFNSGKITSFITFSIEIYVFTTSKRPGRNLVAEPFDFVLVDVEDWSFYDRLGIRT